jgi:putative colanic acid biosysnthesis UDP-glucose lipid carrier transferase
MHVKIAVSPSAGGNCSGRMDGSNDSIVARHSFTSVMVAGLQAVLPAVVVAAMLYAAVIVKGEPVKNIYQSLAAVSSALALLLMQPSRYGSSRVVVDRGSLALSVLMRWAGLLAILAAIGFATKSSEEYSRVIITTWALVTPFMLILMEVLFHDFVRMMQVSQGEVRRAVFAGCNDVSLTLAHRLSESPDARIQTEGYFDDRGLDRLGVGTEVKLLGRLPELAAYVKEHGIDMIFIVLPMRHIQRVIDLLDDLRDTTVSIYYVPDIFVYDLIQARTGDVAGMPVVAMCETPFFGYRGVFKRAMDVIIAGIALIVLSPLMAVIAIVVRLTSPGTAIFRQKRYGLDGQQITVYKFRTMTVSEDGHEVVQARRDDPRLTRFGGFLRRNSLDELPQLYNVLQGRMSLVGPRPHAVAHNEEYRRLIKGYMIRHKVRPGITGLAQVNGCRGETSNLEEMQARVQYDLDYLRRWTPTLDIRILVRTALLVFERSNKAY